MAPCYLSSSLRILCRVDADWGERVMILTLWAAIYPAADFSLSAPSPHHYLGPFLLTQYFIQLPFLHFIYPTIFCKVKKYIQYR